jgi:DNA topoisomerase VI subunit A
MSTPYTATECEIVQKGAADKNKSCLCARLFLKRLRDVLRIPVLALVDADPYGLKILSVYMKGACLLISYSAVCFWIFVGTHMLHCV